MVVLAKRENGDRTELKRWEAKTNAEGVYTLPAAKLPALTLDHWFSISASARGFIEARNWGASAATASQRDVTLGSIKLREGRWVVGRVVSRSGKPTADFHARAIIRNEKDPWGSFAVLPKRAGSKDGGVSFFVPAEGDCELVFTSQTTAPARVKVDSQKRKFGTVELKPGAIVHGTLLGTDHQPISNVTVTLTAMPEEDGPPHLEPRFACMTDRDGRFRFAPFLGKCQLAVADRALDQSRMIPLKTEAALPCIVPVTLIANGEELKQNLRAVHPVRLSGTIRWPNGKGASGVSVSVPGARPVVTDANGRYTVPVTPGLPKTYITVVGQRNASGVFHTATPDNIVEAKQKDNQLMIFESLKNDVAGIDWVLKP